MDAIAKAGAARQAGKDIAIVAALRNSRRDLAVEPGLLPVQHEVDDTGNSVRTIGRRRATGHHVNRANQRRRDQVGVDRSLHGARHEPASVDQNKRTLRIESAQIEQARTDVATQIGLSGRACGRTKARQLVERFTDVVDAKSAQSFRADRRDRGRRTEA